MTDKALLSISLLSSGRADTIERCLVSLSSIKEEIPTEIIIVDTDSEANKPIRIILEKYADKIIPFSWCDDFAAARNAGVFECSGEWFLFVDDDEWFIDPKPLIDFFKSGNYKKYSGADIRIRNYLTEDLSTYNDEWIGRLSKFDKNTKFTGRVHEYLISPPGENAVVSALLGHTGYVFFTDDDRIRHANRNIPLLLKSLEEDPDNIRWYYQLYLEYDSLKERQKQKEICEKALELLKDKNDGKSNAFYGFFLTGYLRLFRIEESWQIVTSKYWELYDFKRIGVTPDAYLHMEMTLACHETGDDKSAKEHAIQYLDIYSRWVEKKESLRGEALFFLSATFEENIYGTVVSLLNEIDIKHGDWKSFDRYFSGLKWEDNLPYDISPVAARYSRILTEVSYDDHFIKIVAAFNNSNTAKQTLRYYMDKASDRGRFNIIKAIEALESLDEADDAKDNTASVENTNNIERTDSAGSRYSTENTVITENTDNAESTYSIENADNADSADNSDDSYSVNRKHKERHRNMSEKMDLSISLLSSGRSETIERCLSSLAPFKEQLNTEIVIVDTDPEHNPEVRKILDKYADKIIEFEWCDDFAAARNAGLFECTGEWFMFVDDDEWFIDAQPIIDFLKSKERNKYTWTNTKIRNYLDPMWENYTDAWVSRLIKRSPDVKFRGMIHECFDPVIGSPKVIDALEGHTGYVYQNSEERKAHSDRNIKLLRKQIEDDPQEPRWVLQLLQEYADSDDIEIQKKIANDGIKLLMDREGESTNRTRGLFAGYLLLLERKASNWEEAVKIYEEISKEKRYNDTARAFNELNAAQAYFYTDDYEESAVHCRNYLRYYKRYRNKLELINPDLMFYMTDTFEDRMWALAACLLMFIEMKEGVFDSYESNFDKVDWSDKADYDFRGYEDEFLKIIEEKEFDERFVHMVETFWSDSISRGVVQDHLEKLGEKREEEYWKLVRVMMEANLPEPTPWDLKIVWADHTGQEVDYEMLYEKMFSVANPLLMSTSVWRTALEHGVDLSAIICDHSFSEWRSGVEYLVAKAPLDVKAELANIIEKFPESDYKNYYKIKIGPSMINGLLPAIRKEAEGRIMGGGNGVIDAVDTPQLKSYQHLEEQFADYSKTTLSHYRKIYSREAIESDSVLMEDDCRLALRLEKILSLVSANEHKAVLAEIKDAIGIFPLLDEALNLYSHLYAEVVKKRISSPEAEMKQLIDTLYAKVDELVANGFVNEAKDIIAQIEAIAPPNLRR